MSTRRPVFLYDSDCGICSRLKAAASFLDPLDRVQFLPILEASRAGLLDQFHPSRRFDSARMINSAGRFSEAGDAIVDLLSFLPGGMLPAEIIRRAPPGLPMARGLYRAVSRQHGKACVHSMMKSMPPARPREEIRKV